MSLREAVTGFVVFLLTVPVAHSADVGGITCSPTKICALKGSTVYIQCTYRQLSRINNHDAGVEKTLWFTSMVHNETVDLRTDLTYAGRVQYHCGVNACTLTIRDVRKSDSAVYKFKIITSQPEWSFTAEPGVTLSVTDIQVQISTNWCKLQCQTSCQLTRHPSYIWYKNGKKTLEKNKSYCYQGYSSDSISCAVKGYEDFPSTPVCATGRSCSRVIYSDRSICAFNGSSVDISANMHSTYDIISSFWFVGEGDQKWYGLKSVDSSKYPKSAVYVEGARSTLKISKLRVSDSGQYQMGYQHGWTEWKDNFPGTTLTVKEPDLQVQVIQSPSGPTLICHSNCLLPGQSSFVWYRNGTKIQEDTSPIYRGFVYGGNSYFCGFEHYFSAPVYAPKSPVVLQSLSSDMVKDSSVTLTCNSDPITNPPIKYAWYKKNQILLNTQSWLYFSSIQPSDSGQYYCTAKNEMWKTQSDFVSINVTYGPQSCNVSVSPSGEIVEGSSVTLTCSTDANPAPSYTWYKENQILLRGAAHTYPFLSISCEDSGVYVCRSENQHGQMNSSVLLDVQCKSNPYCNQTLIKGAERIHLSPISSNDRGLYECTCQNLFGTKSRSKYLHVQYAPRPPSVSVSPSGQIVEGSSVTLTCSSDANPAATYTWYKENEDSVKGTEQMFTITEIRLEHGGNYYCEAQNKRGRQDTMFRLTIDTGAWEQAVTGTISAGLLVFVILAVFLWIRRNRSCPKMFKRNTRPDVRAQLDPDFNQRSETDQRSDTNQRSDLQYNSIIFSQNHADVIYSNIRHVQPQSLKEEDEVEEVEYSVVRFTSAGSVTGTRCKQDEEDLSVPLYSTIKKNTT